MASLTPQQRYKTAISNYRIPNQLAVPATHFSSNILPGKTSFSTRQMRRLKTILTPNEFQQFTGGFTGRKLNSEGLPKLFGRGMKKKKKKEKKKKPRKKKGKNKKRKNKKNSKK